MLFCILSLESEGSNRGIRDTLGCNSGFFPIGTLAGPLCFLIQLFLRRTPSCPSFRFSPPLPVRLTQIVDFVKFPQSLVGMRHSPPESVCFRPFPGREI